MGDDKAVSLAICADHFGKKAWSPAILSEFGEPVSVAVGHALNELDRSRFIIKTLRFEDETGFGGSAPIIVGPGRSFATSG